MIPKVIEARHAGGYKVWLRFADGMQGEIDLSDIFRGPAFEPLRDLTEFAKLRVDPDWHTITWPNDVDIAPESLYARLLAARGGKQAAE